MRDVLSDREWAKKEDAAAKAMFESRGTGLSWERDDHCDEPTRRRWKALANVAMEALGHQREGTSQK